jgi:uncharacterized damage-inducible protein DinB
MLTLAQVRELFAYNAWANRKLFSALAGLSVEDYKRDLKTSFGGVEGTVNHIVWAEELWLRRWQGAPPPAVAQGRDIDSLATARARWETIEADRLRLLQALDEAALANTIVVKPSSGGEFLHPLRETVLHVTDHSTYHRGQIIAMLRQLGRTPPVTGLITFYRERQAPPSRP